MENSAKIRITVSELPLRPRRLADDELQNVFGGCWQSGYICVNNSDCCSGRCTPSAVKGVQMVLRDREVQRHQVEAHQTQVVIERHPVQADVVGVHFEAGLYSSQMRQDIPVGQHHSLGPTRAPGGKLDECGVARFCAVKGTSRLVIEDAAEGQQLIIGDGQRIGDG